MKNKLVVFLAIGSSVTANSANTPVKKESNPNIVLIVADDLGWGDLGYNGSNIKTPNIDLLAREGVILSRFYVAPISSPTRAGLLTGMYPNRFGIRENVIPPWRDFGLDTTALLIPEYLKTHGYKNLAILGKWHLGHSRQDYYPLRNGFTHFYGHLNGAVDYFTHERDGVLDWHNDYASSYDKGYTTDLISEESVRCIRNYSGEGPFFIYVAFNAPHIPLQAKVEDLKLYGYDEGQPTFSGKRPSESPGQGNTRFQTYAAMVSCMDRGIGNILNALKESGIEENTLVIFMSDNGPDVGSGGGSSGPLRGGKFQEFEGGVHVPSIMRWPARFEGGRVIDQLTGFVDIFPTICDIVTPGKMPERFDGISIYDVVSGGKERIKRNFYLGCGALIENDFKILRAGMNPKMNLADDAVFNLKDDPYEMDELSNQFSLKKKLVKQVQKYDAIVPVRVLPPYDEGRENFKAPAEWNLFPE